MVVPDGIAEFLEVQRLVDGHDLIAFCVIGCMERDGELDSEVEIG